MLPNLKKLRAEAGISQQKLADALGVSQQSVNQYENRQIEPDIAMLTRIADYFNTSIDYLVGRTDVRHPSASRLPYHLNPAEADLIARYRALTEEQRDCISRTVTLFHPAT